MRAKRKSTGVENWKRPAIVMLGLLILTLGSSLAKTPSLHPLITFMDEQGVNVLNSGQPISTMQTCGSCHDSHYIASHSFHVDAGLSSMGAPGSVENGHPWDTSPGYYGKWDPMTYRLLSSPGDSLQDLDQAKWIRTQGFRHVGGGPAEYDASGTRLTNTSSENWDWQASGVEEMNCFLCHTPQPNNKARIESLERGDFQWANTATLEGTGIVTISGDRYTWNRAAFNAEGKLKRDYLRIQDPSNQNCGQCHGLVYTAGDAPSRLTSCDWNTATTGEIIAPQQINRTGLNISNKANLTRSWDIHAERAVKCVDCHPSVNNPIYFQKTTEHKLDHLIFDARRIDVEDFLYRPSHDFAKGQKSQAGSDLDLVSNMRRCEGCHNPDAVHDWLPYKDAHFAKVSCEACHIPRMHAPAYEQLDWTVLTLDHRPPHICRGSDGDPQDIQTLIRGFEPILLPRNSIEGGRPLSTYNLISSWYWVYGSDPRPVRLADLESIYLDGDHYQSDIMKAFDADGDGVLSDTELRIDTDAKESMIRQRLENLGLTEVHIRGEVQTHRISHDVTNGEWATNTCTDCHSNQSRIGASMELATYLPGGVVPAFMNNSGISQQGEMKTTADGKLVYRMDLSAEGLYIFGHNSVKWIDWLGILIFLGTLLGVFIHSGYRVYSSYHIPPHDNVTERVYMYTFYERLWHWVQVATIFLLLFTGFIIHKPELFGLFSFPYIVQVHNVLGFILFANAFLAVFYHVVSGEIKQYIPQPHGFFDQAITQAGFYLKGIFRGDEHPFEKTPQKKLNPLQQITYFGLLNFLLPLQIITGLLIWSVQTWPGIAASLGGLPVLAPLHSLLAWLFGTFIVLHMYLTTTGDEPLDGIKAMINGWDEVEVPQKRRKNKLDSSLKKEQ